MADRSRAPLDRPLRPRLEHPWRLLRLALLAVSVLLSVVVFAARWRTFLAWLPVARFAVADTSMQPTLRPGDRVLVLRWARPRPGDVVVLRDPEQPKTAVFLAKRAAGRAAGDGLVVAGDNPNVSRDSRHFGPVPRHLVLGCVIWRYLPADRRGRIGRGR